MGTGEGRQRELGVFPGIREAEGEAGVKTQISSGIDMKLGRGFRGG